MRHTRESPAKYPERRVSSVRAIALWAEHQHESTTTPQTTWVWIPAKGTFLLLFNSHLSNWFLSLLLLSWPLKVTINNLPLSSKTESCKRLQQDNKEISHVSHTFLSHCHFRFLSFRPFSPRLWILLFLQMIFRLISHWSQVAFKRSLVIIIMETWTFVTITYVGLAFQCEWIVCLIY